MRSLVSKSCARLKWRLFCAVVQVDPDTAGLQEKKYQCAVTGKQITFQEVTTKTLKNRLYAFELLIQFLPFITRWFF